MSNSLIVGTEECPIQKIVHILSSLEAFTLFHENWTDIAYDLGIPRVSIEEWKRNRVLNRDSLLDIAKKMLEGWVALKGKEASLSNLQMALESNGMRVTAELLGKEFNGNN